MIKFLYHYWLIRCSGLFDRDYYRRTYANVLRPWTDPLWHFVTLGWQKGYNPSSDFDTRFYLRENRDVRQAGINPLVHYLRAGKSEGRPSSLENDHKHATYTKWVEQYDTLSDSDRELIRLHQNSLLSQPHFSIIMPVEEPDQANLKQAISSVLAQLYPNWELCIGLRGHTNPSLRAIIETFTLQDTRIKQVTTDNNASYASLLNTLLESASGEYFLILGDSDLLSEHALYLIACEINQHPRTNLLYTDEDHVDETGARYQPTFKPQWNPDLFKTHNVIGSTGVNNTSQAKKAGGFRIGFEGAEAWDLSLRMTEKISPTQIRHIPHVLYHHRKPILAEAEVKISEETVIKSERKALEGHFNRYQVPVTISRLDNGYWRVQRHLQTPFPRASLIIPTKNQSSILQKCLESIQNITVYPNYEIIVVNNQSDQPEALAYLQSLSKAGEVTVLDYDHPFNYSAINNFAARHAQGDVLVFLNDDTEVISPNWLQELVSHTIRPEIGAVGAMLYYPNDTIQHAGLTLNYQYIALHNYHKFQKGFAGHNGRARLTQNLSAVTGACLAVEKDKFQQVGGFDKTNLKIAYNDIDLCLRLQKAGYRNVWTPHAELYHHESASRGFEDTLEKKARLELEAEYMREKWEPILADDPANNPNLTLDLLDFSLAFPPRATKPWIEQLEKR